MQLVLDKRLDGSPQSRVTIVGKVEIEQYGRTRLRRSRQLFGIKPIAEGGDLFLRQSDSSASRRDRGSAQNIASLKPQRKNTSDSFTPSNRWIASTVSGFGLARALYSGQSLSGVAVTTAIRFSISSICLRSTSTAACSCWPSDFDSAASGALSVSRQAADLALAH
jgi:hypothetical protein